MRASDKRHAPMVVEAAGGGEAAALALEGAAQRLLGAGLADAAGDGDDGRAWRAGALRAPSASSAACVSATMSSGASAGELRRRAADQRRRGALGKGVGDEIMAVEIAGH